MTKRLWAVAVVLAVAGAIMLVSSPARAEGETTRQIEKLFREGVDFFEMGDFRNAKIRFEQVLKLDPTQKEASRLVKEAGHKIMIRMMTQPRVGRGPHRVWDLYRRHQRQLMRDEKRTQEIVDRVCDERTNLVKVWADIQKLQDIGPFAVPALAPHLANVKDEDKRTRARVVCTKLGSDAVLPLIELLEHPSLMMRENAAYILGHIEPSDSRAVGPLKSVLEDPKAEQPLKTIAGQMLERITGLKPSGLRPAKEYYYLKADRYYREVPGVPYEAEESEGVIWHLSKDKDLKYREVPMYAWNEQMAEQACYDLLALDGNYERIVPLFACVIAQQISEAQDLFDISIEKPPGRPLSADEIAEIKARRELLRDGEMLVRSCGARHVYRGVDKALNEGVDDPKGVGVAVVLIHALRDIDPRGTFLPRAGVAAVTPGEAKPSRGGHDILEEIELLGDEELGEEEEPAGTAPAGGEETVEYATRAEGAPLCKALDYYDERVRYAAAISLAHMDPLGNFPGAKKVVGILADAVGESGPLQVLIIESDPNVRNNLKSNLEEVGIGVKVAATTRTGLVEAKAFPPKDIVLVGRKLPVDNGMGTKEILKELAGDVRTSPVPVAILTRHDNLRADKNNPVFAGLELVPAGDKGRVLKEMMLRISYTRGLAAVSKLHAEEVSIAASQALNKIDPYHTHTVPADCAGACIAALRNRSDDVRNPCITALGKFKIGKAFPDLVKLFNDKANTLELRTNALWSIGQIRPQSAYALFLKAQKDEKEYSLRLLAATGHGLGKPGMSTLIRFLNSERIKKSEKED